nr:polyamine transporter 4 [Quercus suber]
MQVMAEFQVSREIALLPFAFYLLGLSFGPVLASPISETFGRRLCYIAALPVFAAFTIGAGFANSITTLIITRFFAGLFSSPGLSIGTGSLSDVWSAEKRGAPMAVYVTSVQMGPALGPLIGGYVTVNQGWRWTQWVILFGLAFVLVLTLGMSETYKKKILQSRAKKFNIPGPPEPERSKIETAKFFLTKTVTRPISMFCTEPIVTLFDIYVAFNFGLLNAFFAAFAWVFKTRYNFGLGTVGLTYLGQAVGSLFGLAIMLYITQIHWKRLARNAKQQDQDAKLEPESRLLMAKIGAPLLPISLFWFGWTAEYQVMWLSPVVAEALFSCGNLLVFTTASLYITDCYGALYGASAWASNTSLRYFTAFAFPLFAVQMYEGLGTGWATSLLGFVSLLLVPISFAFDRYGPRLRGRSKYTASQ